jgi:hypothetical protein
MKYVIYSDREMKNVRQVAHVDTTTYARKLKDICNIDIYKVKKFPFKVKSLAIEILEF